MTKKERTQKDFEELLDKLQGLKRAFFSAAPRAQLAFLRQIRRHIDEYDKATRKPAARA